MPSPRRPLRWLVRNVQIFLPLSTFTARLAIDILTGKEEERRQLRASELLAIISGLGLSGICSEW